MHPHRDIGAEELFPGMSPIINCFKRCRGRKYYRTRNLSFIGYADENFEELQ